MGYGVCYVSRSLVSYPNSSERKKTENKTKNYHTRETNKKFQKHNQITHTCIIRGPLLQRVIFTNGYSVRRLSNYLLIFYFSLFLPQYAYGTQGLMESKKGLYNQVLSQEVNQSKIIR